MADSISHFFRSINHTFLDKEWEQGFSVYYQVVDSGKKQFLKFAEYTPEDYTRLEKIMRDSDRQDFFIHETDLVRYYRECILLRLVEGIEQDKPSPLETIKRSYPILVRIFSDYLDFNTSTRILRILDDLPALLCPALMDKSVTFPSLVSFTKKDNTIQHHCINVGLYCMFMGRFLKLEENDKRDLLLGGILADMGKKEFPNELVGKSVDLTEEESSLVRKHPSSARKTLNDMKCYSDQLLRMVKEHHENMDGSGYPLGLAGDKISLFARVCRLMDTFNALTSDRPYQKLLSPPKALAKIRDEMANQIDGNVRDLLFKSLSAK